MPYGGEQTLSSAAPADAAQIFHPNLVFSKLTDLLFLRKHRLKHSAVSQPKLEPKLKPVHKVLVTGVACLAEVFRRTNTCRHKAHKTADEWEHFFAGWHTSWMSRSRPAHRARRGSNCRSRVYARMLGIYFELEGCKYLYIVFFLSLAASFANSATCTRHGILPMASGILSEGPGHGEGDISMWL